MQAQTWVQVLLGVSMEPARVSRNGEDVSGMWGGWLPYTGTLYHVLPKSSTLQKCRCAHCKGADSLVFKGRGTWAGLKRVSGVRTKVLTRTLLAHIHSILIWSNHCTCIWMTFSWPVYSYCIHTHVLLVIYPIILCVCFTYAIQSIYYFRTAPSCQYAHIAYTPMSFVHVVTLFVITPMADWYCTPCLFRPCHTGPSYCVGMSFTWYASYFVHIYFPLVFVFSMIYWLLCFALRLLQVLLQPGLTFSYPDYLVLHQGWSIFYS